MTNNISSKHKNMINLGSQPISNRYSKKPLIKAMKTELNLEQSQDTGIIRLKDTINPKAFKPLVKWITYNEPELHLDNFVETILKKNFNNRKIEVGAISTKDRSALDRFKNKGHKVFLIDEIKDLKLSVGSGIETIQDALNSKKIKYLNNKYNSVDLLLVRHIWEHVYDQADFSKVLKSLIKPDGLIFIEVPDCRKLLKSQDISMIWEEHLFYYTSETIVSSMRQHGFRVVYKKIFKYPTESSILLCVKKYKKNIALNINKIKLKRELLLGHNYSISFKKNKSFLHKLFKNKVDNKKKIVIFGGGHLALAFIAFYNLYNYINCIIDDDKNKINLYMPNSSIQIKSSDELKKFDNLLVLLSVNLTNEKKLREIIFNKTNGSILIKSIFPLSKYSIFK